MKLSLSVRRREPPPDQLIRLFQSETAEIRESSRPLWAHSAVLWLGACFALLIGVSLVWPLDRVVSSVSGHIVTTETPIVLQALDPSIIKTIDVREGERVQKGQLLATLDPTFAAADVDALKMQIASLDAQIARCEAELSGKPFAMPANVLSEAAIYSGLQKSYYVQRKSQFDAQMRSYAEQIAQFQATIAKFQKDQALYADRASISKQIENMRATLAASQVGSRLNLLVATDNKLEILRNLELDHNTLVENEHQLQTVVANRNAFVQQWLGQVSQELVTARTTRDTARQNLAKATKHEALVHLTSPEDAVVLKMTDLSVGSVLKQGDPMMTLALLQSPVEVAAHINARDVGFIRPGDRATIKISAFNYAQHGAAEGRVRWISDGTFTRDDDGKPVADYYKVRIALTKVALADVPESFRLIPGMTLDADIHVGKRSAFMYMFGSFAGVSEAMREP
jgi:membrane fusion protein, hemolysin D